MRRYVALAIVLVVAIGVSRASDSGATAVAFSASFPRHLLVTRAGAC
jgi:hypothetical protein